MIDAVRVVVAAWAWGWARGVAAVAALAGGLLGCGSESPGGAPGEEDGGDAAALPDATVDGGGGGDASPDVVSAPVVVRPRCPEGMALVGGFCIDRWEATVVMPGWCNEGKGSMLPYYYGSNPANWTYADFNDPRLDQIDGGLAPTGSYAHCVSPWGVADCVGNLHEWGADPPDANGHGRFRGGFYGDAEVNGHGCLYVTSAHEPTYHDYSTGFRCCADSVTLATLGEVRQ